MLNISKVSEYIQTNLVSIEFYVLQGWKADVCFFIINFFSWKTALLKTCHSPSNSSLLIIARGEYVTTSNVTSVLFSIDVSQG